MEDEVVRIVVLLFVGHAGVERWEDSDIGGGV